jgi:hypothetical protein
MKNAKILADSPDNSVAQREAQQELLQHAPQPLIDKVDWIIGWYKSDTKQLLIRRWELGEQVSEILEDAENGSKVYGTYGFKTIAAFSGEAEGSLRHCAKMFDFYTREQITKLSEKVMSDGCTPLSFSHIRAVLSLDHPTTGKKDRAEVLELALEKCWKASELSEYVSKINSNTASNNKAGRPVGKPRDVMGVINQQLSFAEDFEKRNVAVWKSPDHGLKAQLEKIPETGYTEELKSQLGVLAHKLRQLAEEADAGAKEAERRYRDVESVLSRRYKDGLKLASQLQAEDRSGGSTVVTSPEEEMAGT